MSIFIDPNKTFSVRVKYQEVFDEYGDQVSVKILPQDAQGEDVKELVCDATGRDFETMSRIMEDATVINHVTGKPLVRIRVLAHLIVVNFIKGWNAGPVGNRVPINSATVGKLHYNMVRAIARRWLAKTGGKVKSETL